MPSNDCFVREIEKMEEFFSKNLKGARPQFWEELSWIPDDAFVDVCTTWMRMHKPFPSHFPSIDDLKQGHVDWQQSNPDRVVQEEYVFCPYCVDGYITVEIPIPNSKWYYKASRTVIVCGHCVNYKHRNPEFRRMKRDHIEAKGWKILTPIRERDKEEDVAATAIRPDSERSPGMTHIERSLPIGDRDMGQDEIPF